MVWPSDHGMVCGMALGHGMVYGMAWWEWHEKGMAWRAWHSIQYGLNRMAWRASYAI